MPRKKADDTTIGPVFQVRDLTGGVNLRASQTNIKPEQARRLLNTLISSVGELAVYPGFQSFTTSLGDRRAQGGKRIYLSDSTFTLVADNGEVYKPSDAGAWGSSVLSGLHASNPVDFVYDRDIVSAFDGSTVPQKTEDGTTWTQLGISPPAAAPVLAAVAGGSLISGNTYEVAYCYQDDSLNHRGNVSATAQQAVSGANLTVRATVVASADPQVDKIVVFCRDVTSSETVLRLQGTYSNTNQNINITSNNWDGQDEAPLDHNVAVAMSFGVVWKNRWWGRDATVKNRLRFSQIFQSQSWPATFFVDIPFERGEDLTCAIPLGDVLIVFGYTKFYLIIGQTSLDFEVRPALGGQTGAFGFRAADVLENGVVHAGAPGAYLFNGASDELLSYSIDPAWRSFVSQSTPTDLDILPVTYHKLFKELRVGVSFLYPTNTRGEWVLDLNRTNVGGEAQTGPAWFSTDRAVGGYIQWDGNEASAGNHGRIFSWSPTQVKLFEERVGTSADGSDISMEYDGYVLPFGLQVARIIDTYVEHQASSGLLTASLKVDGKIISTQSFALGADLQRWGEFVWGVDPWGGGVDRTTLPIIWPESAEGRSVQLLLRYVGQGDYRTFTYGHNTFSEPVPRGL